ncbi:MAG TPA: YetF domain-containing protein, partial [Candidatus Sulfotelmatobacter sp.]|nr:YetF domain-containing protein [Candidatus Sulfotelmatobacter sp.]
LRDVEFAILEPSGALSVLRSSDIPAGKEPPARLPRPLVMNGQVVQKNLAELNLTEQWLRQKLARNGRYDLADVAYAELEPDGVLYVDRRQDGQPG